MMGAGWRLGGSHVARFGMRSMRKLPTRCASSEQPNTESNDSKPQAAESSQLTLADRLKATVKLYGLTATAFHSSVYVLSLGTTFVAVRNGLDTAELLRSWGLGDHIEMIPPEAGDLAAAWCICAVTGPARGVLTVAASPAIANYLNRRRNFRNNDKSTT